MGVAHNFWLERGTATQTARAAARVERERNRERRRQAATQRNLDAADLAPPQFRSAVVDHRWARETYLLGPGEYRAYPHPRFVRSDSGWT